MNVNRPMNTPTLDQHAEGRYLSETERHRRTRTAAILGLLVVVALVIGLAVVF